MNQQAILNATIAIEDISDKGKKLSIKGNDGNRTKTYNVWKTKQDGTNSQAYQQFLNMGLAVGQNVFIGYVIDEYETEIGGYPKRVSSNKVINFREATQGPQTAEKPRGEAPSASGDKSEEFWDKKAFKQCLWNYWLNGERQDVAHPTAILTAQELEVVWQVFNQIEKDAEKRFAKGWAKAVATVGPQEDLPVIQQEEIDMSDVPF